MPDSDWGHFDFPPEVRAAIAAELGEAEVGAVATAANLFRSEKSQAESRGSSEKAKARLNRAARKLRAAAEAVTDLGSFEAEMLTEGFERELAARADEISDWSRVLGPERRLKALSEEMHRSAVIMERAAEPRRRSGPRRNMPRRLFVYLLAESWERAKGELPKRQWIDASGAPCNDRTEASRREGGPFLGLARVCVEAIDPAELEGLDDAWIDVRRIIAERRAIATGGDN